MDIVIPSSGMNINQCSVSVVSLCKGNDRNELIMDNYSFPFKSKSSSPVQYIRGIQSQDFSTNHSIITK